MKFKVGDIVRNVDEGQYSFKFITRVTEDRYYFYYLTSPEFKQSLSKNYLERYCYKVNYG